MNYIFGTWGVYVLAILLVANVAAWVQHFITTLAAEAWVLLAVGAFVPFVGIIHGWLIWLGIV